MTESIKRATGFIRYAWFVVAYLVGVILWGAVVRATGSGAGCGNHWPACNGEIVPLSGDIATLIEFGHRITSGLSGVLIVILVIWVFRLKPASKFVRTTAIMSLIFVLFEAFLGAMLVRLDLVADNVSVLRAIAVGLHLLNTLVLLAWVALTAWGAAQSGPMRRVASRETLVMVILALLGFGAISAIGAVTALGDTLILSGVIGGGTDYASHFLISLRSWHPMLAILVSGYLVAIGIALRPQYQGTPVTAQVTALFVVVGLQVCLGGVNILLKAPVWMQVVHLLTADSLWILLVTLSANLLSIPPTAAAE